MISLQCISISSSIYKLVENARKFRESAPNQILIFGEPRPQVGVSENVWFFKFKRVDQAKTGRNQQILYCIVLYCILTSILKYQGTSLQDINSHS